MEPISSRTRQMEEDDKKYLWHPFTQMRSWTQEKILIIEEGTGCCLKDVEGNWYLDGVSSLWTNVHGHRKDKLDRALKEQVDRVAHSTLLGLANVPSILLAKRLIEIAPPGLTRVFYSDSGATAVEIALKMAFQYHQQSPNGSPLKTRFVCLTNSYHGDTLGSVSVGGIDLFHSMYQKLLFPTYRTPSPFCYRCPLDRNPDRCSMACLAELEKILEQHAHEVAAVIIEPLVQGAAGILVHPRGYLRGVRDLCTRYGVFMIADEVAVGFGKTGKMFACEHEGVTPDLMALAKGISGGYLPLAATLAKEEIYEGFLGEYEEFKTFFHGHTFTGNPLGCAVALAGLDIFREEEVLASLQDKILHLSRRLEPFRSLPYVGDVRQCGVMVGIELVADKATKEPFPLDRMVGYRVILEARKRGIIIRPLGDVIVLMPPLAIGKEQIDTLCTVVYDSIRAVTEDGEGHSTL